MASTTKETPVLSTTSAFMNSESLFKAFAPSDQPITSTAGNLGMSPTRPPAGSRLIQYMQPQQRKQSTTPVNNGPAHMQNGPHFDQAAKENMLCGNLVQSHPMNMGPSTSFRPSVNPSSVTPPTQSFSQLNLSPRHNTQEFVPGKMIHQSVSNPAFVEGHVNFPHPMHGFVNSRNTPTPPVKVKLNKSPVVIPEQPFVQESIGGTTYFYNHEEQQGPFPGGLGPPQHNPELKPPTQTQQGLVFPNFYSYQGSPSHLAHYRPKGAGVASYFTPSELKMELMERQMLSMAEVDPEKNPDIPLEVENYENLVPLEAVTTPSQFPERPGFFLHYACSVYKGVSIKDGLAYSLRRLHNCRLVNPRCLSLVDTWKKLFHTGVVQLREMCTTKCFGDYSLVFVYDYHPGAETMKYRHFSGLSKVNVVTQTMFEEFDHSRARPQSAGKFVNGAPGCLSESLIWTYVVQLSSALRAIHAAGLAARTVEPSKILIVGRSKLMINCCGVMDVLTFDQAQHNMAAAIQHYQQEDLIGLGRIVVALTCWSLGAASRENLASSIAFVAQNYSQDLKNLVTYLLSPAPGRLRNINDIMPMIGARFYAQLDSAQTRIDMLENEVTKEVENGRLFRLLCKLGTVNERPEYNMDPTWSETGDRYLLKLFRDYLFHQVSEDGRPWIDMAHVVQCLNKVEAGSHEKISLVSRDEQNVLVVSYSDLKRCIDQAFQELLAPDGIVRNQ